MKRSNVVKNIVKKVVSKDDLLLVYGNTLSKETYTFDENCILYLKEEIDISFIIGLSMCTNRKVILFCTGIDIIKNLDAFVQIALSKLKNIVCVVLDGEVDEDINQPSLFREITSVRGVLFNLGFIVHDYSHLFDKSMLKEVKKAFDRMIGPICVLVKTSKGVDKKLDAVELTVNDNINRFKKIMAGK